MKIRDGVIITKRADGAFVLDGKSTGCFALNPEGLDVWEMIEAGNASDDIIATLAELRPGSDINTVRADVNLFIDALISRGLISD